MTESKISRLLRSASGSSQPWHAQLEDGSAWIVKFAGAGPGREALLAECIANRLGRLWGFPIPEVRPVHLNDSVERAGTDEFWDVLDASRGWNLGIRTIAGTVNVTPNAELLGDTLESLLAFDRLLVNWDRTVLSRNLIREQDGKLWWIDHGSCRFLHRLSSRAAPMLPSNHFLFEEQNNIVARSLPALSSQELVSCLAHVPEEWMTQAGHDLSSLSNALEAYLASQVSQ